MAERGNRDEIVIATKVGAARADRKGLRADEHQAPRPRIRCARLQTDRIDLYYTHFDDEVTPLEETLARARRSW